MASYLRSSHLGLSCAAFSYPQIVAFQIFMSFIFASASHLCIFISRIFPSSLSSSDLHILKPHLVFTSSDVHHEISVPSYHLQDFIALYLQCDKFTFQNFLYLDIILSLSGQPSSTLFGHLSSNLAVLLLAVYLTI